MATAAEVPNQPIFGSFGSGRGQARVYGGAVPLPGQGLDGIGQGVGHRLQIEQIQGQKGVGHQHGAVMEILFDTVATQPNDKVLFAKYGDNAAGSLTRRTGEGQCEIAPFLKRHPGERRLNQREGLGDPLGGQGPSLESSHCYTIISWNTAAIYALGKPSVVDLHQEEHNAFRRPTSHQDWLLIVHCNT